MSPETFAQAIASIEHNYGLRLDARSVWLRIDATPCGSGWAGNKPGCKRAGKATAVQPAKEPIAKPDQPEILKDKPGGTIVKARTRAKKLTVPKKAEIPDDTKSNEPTFESVADLKSLKKEWGADIAKARSYIPISMLMGDDRRLEDHQKTVEALEPGEKKVLWMPGFPPKPLNGTKEQWQKKLPKDRAALAQKIESTSKGLDKTLDTEKIADNLNIIESIQQNSKSKSNKIISGGVASGGKLQAAYVLSKKKDHLYVEYLAANPASFLKTGGTKGAGRAAIVDIVKRSFDEGHNGKVKLEALPGAAGFYKKMGFTTANGEDFELSPEQAKKILAGKF